MGVWEEVGGKVRALVLASSNIFTFSAGADIKEFTKMSPDAEGADLVQSAHRFMRGMEQSSTVTIAAVNSIAFGGGCELAMACDFRIAAESATFGQPEINLGIIPGFGGTQRLPRLVGESKALEMNLTGDPIDAYEAHRVGLANQVVPDHELFDTAVAWARKLADQAPIAVEEIKKRSATPRSTRASRARARASRAPSARRTRRRASPPSSPSGARVPGQVRTVSTRAQQVADLLRQSDRAVVLTGAGISVPSGIPDFRSPGTGLWEKVDPMEVAHIDAWRRDPDRFWSFYGDRFASLVDKQPNEAHLAVAELERRGLVRAVVTQNIDRLHRLAGSERLIEVHGSIDESVCLECGARLRIERVVELLAAGRALRCARPAPRR